MKRLTGSGPLAVSIVGCGHVGLVTGACLAEVGHEVLGVDSDAAKVRLLRRGRLPIYEPGLPELVRRNRRAGRLRFAHTVREAVQFGDVILICVPTPPRPDGQADLTYLSDVSREIARHVKSYRLVVEKSTVPVRTCERVKAAIQKYARPGADFDVASNPEFLREGAAVADTMKPDRIVVGVETRRAAMILRRLYAPFGAPIVETDIKSAELIKHASNSFLALKISYANALAALCERAGADVEQVTHGMGLDRRIGPAFLRAGLGFGGSCFPKDVRAFEALSRDLGYDFPLLREVQRLNQEAADRFLKLVEHELWILRGKVVAAWGLAFKPDTDDVRESVALAVVRRLLEAGSAVRAYDPQAMAQARAALGPHRRLVFAAGALEAARRADAIVVLTEWREFSEVDFRKVKRRMAHPTILDGRNLLDPARMRGLGFTYRSVGRP